MAEKANSIASTDRGFTEFPRSAQFYDGTPFNPARGGLVTTAGQLYSVADPTQVPPGPMHERASEERGHLVPNNRVVSVAVQETVYCAAANGEKTKGFESELVAIAPDTGEYVQVTSQTEDGVTEFRGFLGKIGILTPELHNFAAEIGYQPVRGPEEAQQVYVETTGVAHDAAQKEGVLLADLETVGQRKLTDADLNPHPYVQWIQKELTAASGFSTPEMFAVYSKQGHESLRDTASAVQASADMQAVKPLAVAGSLGGPFIRGQHNFHEAPQFGTKQAEHARHRGVRPSDLMGEAHSWRYLYRRLGSPAAGTWDRVPAESHEEHLTNVHEALQSAQISTIDRYFGQHTDRVRYGIGETGTAEDCSQGAYAGNPKKNVAHQIIGGAQFGSTELMRIHGQNPADKFPRLFDREVTPQTLAAHNRENITVHKEGMGAVVRGKKVYTYGHDLIKLATHDPANNVPQWAIETYLKSFTSNEDTLKALKDWCRQNDCKPSMRAYHELELGTPSVYMKAMYEAFQEEFPRATETEIIQLCELDIALSTSHQLEKERAALANGVLWH